MEHETCHVWVGQIARFGRGRVLNAMDANHSSNAPVLLTVLDDTRGFVTKMLKGFPARS
jgi:hypothetical protein